MKYLAAYALLKLGGNAEPTASDVEVFLKENGVKADKEKVEELIEKLGGKDFGQLVESGIAQISTLAPEPSVLPADAADAGEATVEKVVEEKEDIDMTGLFGGSDDEY